MTPLEAIILGIIQGISEFLPISSSGHLALTKQLLGIAEPDMPFIIVVHLGTLVPVLIIYRKDIWQLIKRPFQKMTALLIIATLPAVLVALFFSDRIESAFASVNFIAGGLIITGIALMLSDRVKSVDMRKDGKNISRLDALLIGIAQAIAVLPGISRSGSTITAALGRKITRDDAAKFSFFMSIPAILGAAVLYTAQIVTGRIYISSLDPVALGLGFLSAALSGYLAINSLLAIIRKAKLRYFAYYVFLLAGVIIFDIMILNGVIFGG